MRPGPAVLAALACACARPQPPVVVGSKPFTESEIVGEIIAQLAESQGCRVERRFYVGANLCLEALKTGAMDVYVEYTGTGLVDILGEPAMTDPAKVYERVKAEFQRRWGLEWLKPLGFNNTYALVMRGAEARGLAGLSSLSSMKRKLRCGFDLEFADRPDGYRGLILRLGSDFCAGVSQMNPGLMYTALARSQVDLISGYATDGRIPQLGLAALKDDLRFFPPYEAAPLAGAGLRRKAPRLAEALDALSGRLSTETMTRLNAEVDVKKRPVAEVAREFLAGTRARSQDPP